MAIEYLKFFVSPELREKFIETDREIWTSALAKYPGFLSKEVWINPEIPEEIIIIARWKTRQEWKAIPIDILEAIEREFAASMGENEYKLVESKEYQVRKFP
ncbi:MAG: TIGR03792 family protein [Prochloraceae cyanobacterium]